MISIIRTAAILRLIPHDLSGGLPLPGRLYNQLSWELCFYSVLLGHSLFDGEETFWPWGPSTGSPRWRTRTRPSDR